MKQIVISIAAMLMLTTAAMAQEEQGQRPQRQRMDRTEMIQKRTDDVVKKYGLDEKQAKQLLSLNTKFADKMGGRRGMRPDGHGQRPDRRGQRPDMKQNNMKAPNDTARMRRPDGPRPNREQMEENMKAYDKELQEIMTAEQYKAYKADMEKRRQEGRQRQ